MTDLMRMLALGLTVDALIEEAAKKTLKKMKSMLVGKMGVSTADVGDSVVKNL